MRVEYYFGSKLPLGDYVKPETFQLPKAGEQDPHFGLSRTTYYELEKAGAIQMVRIGKRGKQRGITLIVFDQVLAHVRRAMSKGGQLTRASFPTH